MAQEVVEPKLMLQSLLQRAGYALPRYTCEQSGPPHLPSFEAQVITQLGTFAGQRQRTRKAAEQSAAAAALQGLHSAPNGADAAGTTASTAATSAAGTAADAESAAIPLAPAQAPPLPAPAGAKKALILVDADGFPRLTTVHRWARTVLFASKVFAGTVPPGAALLRASTMAPDAADVKLIVWISKLIGEHVAKRVRLPFPICVLSRDRLLEVAAHELHEFGVRHCTSEEECIDVLRHNADSATH